MLHNDNHSYQICKIEHARKSVSLPVLEKYDVPGHLSNGAGTLSDESAGYMQDENQMNLLQLLFSHLQPCLYTTEVGSGVW